VFHKADAFIRQGYNAESNGCTPENTQVVIYNNNHEDAIANKEE
jgi:hypothetical protein